jgi:hypothetical protein
MGARATGRIVIELPHEFLNALFAALIVLANVKRLRNAQLRQSNWPSTSASTD